MSGWLKKLLASWGFFRQPADTETALIELATNNATPPKAGRISVEDFSVKAGLLNFLQDTAGLNPVVPFETVEWLSRAALINPDMNHATTNLVNLANNGHNLSLDAASESIIAAAHARLNERAQNLYPRSAGIDGLINHYIEQIAVTGAISSEDVIAAKRDGVAKVVLVPTERIRFKYLDGEYKPFQLLRDGKMIELDERTYSYFAFRTAQNSPYAIPLYLAALESIMGQRDMQKNVNFIMRKFGLLGLVALTLQPPKQKPGESENELSGRKETYLNRVLDAVRKNFLQGLMVKFADQTLEHHNIAGDARGSKDLWELNEQQVASGMGVDPTIIGRNYTSTETFANVTYMFLIRQANNIRQLAKRRMEKTYGLDLQLQGLAVTELRFNFKDNPARDPLAEAQARETRERAIIRKAERGVIDPDTAAQEMGYDAWFDVDRLNVAPENPITPANNSRKVLSWNAGLQRYDFNRPRVLVVKNPATLARVELASEKVVRRVLEEWSAKYLKKIAPFLGNSVEEAAEVLAGFVRRSSFSDFRDENDFAEQAFGVISSIYVDAFRGQPAQNALRDAVKEIYSFYRVDDRSVFEKAPEVKFTLDTIDTRTLTFVRGLDRHYLSKYIFNSDTERQVMDWLKQQWLENGEGLFGRTSREAIRTFQALAVDTLEPLSEYQAQRIINTSVQRMRTWGHIGQLAEAGFEFAKVYNPDPEAEICQYMNGQVIPIGEAREAVDELSRLSPEQYQQRLKPVSGDDIARIGVRAATRQGIGFPPYHPNCKTRLIATEERDDRLVKHEHHFARNGKLALV